MWTIGWLGVDYRLTFNFTRVAPKKTWHQAPQNTIKIGVSAAATHLWWQEHQTFSHPICPTVRKKKEGGCKVDYGLTCPFCICVSLVFLICFSSFCSFSSLLLLFFLLFLFLRLLLIIILVLVFLQTWKERSTWSKKGRKKKKKKGRKGILWEEGRGRKEERKQNGLWTHMPLFFWSFCECVTVVFFFVLFFFVLFF